MYEINLEPVTSKTFIDNENIQVIGEVDSFVAALKERASKYKKPVLLIIRSEPNKSLGIYLFESKTEFKMPPLEMPKVVFGEVLK